MIVIEEWLISININTVKIMITDQRISQKSSRIIKIWLTGIIICLLLMQFVKNDSALGPAKDIPNFHRVEPGILRGGRPQADGLNMLVSLNVKTIINLERGWFRREPVSVKQERSFADANNIQFIHIPMHPFFKPSTRDVQSDLDILTTSSSYPIFIHCRKGSDRTGIVVGAFRIRYHGWTAEQAETEMRRYGFRAVFLFWWKNVLKELEMEVNGKPYVI